MNLIVQVVVAVRTSSIAVVVTQKPNPCRSALPAPESLARIFNRISFQLPNW